MHVRPIFLLMALVAALSLGGALAQERLVVAGGAEATGLDPRRVNDVPSFQRIYAHYEPLIAFEKDLTYRPRLATDWSVSEDGSEITFNLRRGRQVPSRQGVHVGRRQVHDRVDAEPGQPGPQPHPVGT
jgi:ABC-type transport system substrate-binding protein